MFLDERNPPHFHARYAGYKIEIGIQTLQVLAGRFPPRGLGLVMKWASLHQDELLENWDRARRNAELNRIEPLE